MKLKVADIPMPSSDEQEANTRLIAAAPDMYEALKNIITYEDRGREKGEPRISEKWYNQAKAAISKATN